MDTINGKRVFSLQYKIMLFSLIIILIPLIIIGWFSYSNTSAIIGRKESEANLETIKQIDSGINFIFTDVHDTSLYLIQQDKLRSYLKGQNKDFLSSKDEIANYITYLVTPKSYIYSVYIRSADGNSFDTNEAENVISYSDEEKVKLLNGGYLWTENEVTDYTGKRKVFSIIRMIRDTNDIRKARFSASRE